MNAKKQREKIRRRANRMAQEAWVAADDNNFDLAIRIIRRAVELNPANPVLWNDQGTLLLELQQDEPALLASYEAMVQRWIDGLAGLPGVTAERRYPSEAGQPHSRAIVHLGPGSRLGRTELVAALWDADPRIAVSEVDSDAIALNPQTLEPGEDQLVLDALRRLL